MHLMAAPLPAEFIALKARDRRRVWHRCLLRALVRPKVVLPLIGLGLVLVILLMSVQVLQRAMGFTVLANLLINAILSGALMGFVYGRFVVMMLHEDIRRTAMGCLSCWHDMAGCQSDTCPRCGATRTYRRGFEVVMP